MNKLLIAAKDALMQFAHNGDESDSDKEVLDALQAAITEAENAPPALWHITGERAREFSTPHSDGRYLCVVHMLRELSDDEEFIEGKTGEAMGEALAKQLAVELQAGYDDAGIAGHFQVMSVTLPPDEDSEFVYEQKARAAGWSKLHPTIPNPEGYVMHPDRYHPAGNVVAYLTWKECCECENLI